MKSSLSPLKRVALVLSHLDKFLPLRLKIVFYRFPFFLFKTYINLVKTNGSLWLRNSVYFDEMVFPMSDIDLSYLFDKPMKKVMVDKLEVSLKRWKVLFPHFGEIAYFDLLSLKKFGQFANYYELARDPILLKTLEDCGGEKSAVKRGSDIAFILRWLESDIHQLLVSFERRARKTSRFLKILERPWDNASEFSGLVDKLLGDPRNSVKILEVEQVAIKKFLVEIISKKSEGLINAHLQNDYENILLIYFPHIWVGLPMESKLETWALASMNDGQKTICKAQVEWEIWGLYNQVSRVKDKNALLVHIDSLRHLCELMEASELVKACNELEGFGLSFWYGESKY